MTLICLLKVYLLKIMLRLAIEMYKTKINQNPDFKNDIFRFHESSYPLRNESFFTKGPNTVIYGTETVSYRCSQIWNSIRLNLEIAYCNCL